METGRACAVRRGHGPVVAARGPSGERARRSVAAKRAVQQTTRPAGEDPQGSLRAGTAGQDPGFADWFDPRSRPHAEQCIAAGLLMGRRPAHQAAATGLRQWGHRRSSSSTCPPHVGQRHALAAAVPSGCITSGLATPRRVLGLQVAVFGGAFGLAASAFSFARFCSHCSFLMARLRRCLRRVRGSCGVPMVGRVLPQVPRSVLRFFTCRRPASRDESETRSRQRPKREAGLPLFHVARGLPWAGHVDPIRLVFTHVEMNKGRVRIVPDTHVGERQQIVP